MKQSSRLLTVLGIGGLVALMLFFAAETIGNFLRDLPRAVAYNAAPTCPAGENITPDGAPCRAWVEAVVTEQWEDENTPSRGGDHYYLGLLLAGGDNQQMELPDTVLPWGGLWQQMKVGDSVQAEVWQSTVTHVRAGGRTEPTDHDPASQGWGSLLSLICVAPYALVVVLLIGVALVLSRQSPKPGQPAMPPEQPVAPHPSHHHHRT